MRQKGRNVRNCSVIPIHLMVLLFSRGIKLVMRWNFLNCWMDSHKNKEAKSTSGKKQ